jgi:hypothetical protein
MHTAVSCGVAFMLYHCKDMVITSVVLFMMFLKVLLLE